MNFPTIPQLIFLANNSNDKLLSEFVDEKYFIFFLVSHTKNYFHDLNINLNLTEPFLDPSIEIEQHSTLLLNDFEIGEISLFYNSVFDEFSLVYYSPSGFLKTSIMDSESFGSFTVNDYLVLLHEFTAILRSEFDLYSNFRQNT